MQIDYGSINESVRGVLKDIKISKGMPICIYQGDAVEDSVVPFHGEDAPGMMLITQQPRQGGRKFNKNAMDAFAEIGVDIENDNSGEILKKLNKLKYEVDEEGYDQDDEEFHILYSFSSPDCKATGGCVSPFDFVVQENEIIERYIDGGLYTSVSALGGIAGYEYGDVSAYSDQEEHIAAARKDKNSQWGVVASKAISVKTDAWSFPTVVFSDKPKNDVAFAVSSESEANEAVAYLTKLGAKARVINRQNELSAGM